MNRAALIVCGISVTLGAEAIAHPDKCAVIATQTVAVAEHYSQATIDRWKAWREDWKRKHPGKPLPPTLASRRKSRQDSLKDFDFACGPLEPESEELTALLAEPEGSPIFALLDNGEYITLIKDDSSVPPLTGPVDTATNEGYPLGYPVIFGGGVGYPSTPLPPSPPIVPIPSPVPEPAAIVLLGTGIAAAMLRRWS